jgi:hypothetical protein
MTLAGKRTKKRQSPKTLSPYGFHQYVTLLQLASICTDSPNEPTLQLTPGYRGESLHFTRFSLGNWECGRPTRRPSVGAHLPLARIEGHPTTTTGITNEDWTRLGALPVTNSCPVGGKKSAGRDRELHWP